jgi:hypothetical protein
LKEKEEQKKQETIAHEINTIECDDDDSMYQVPMPMDLVDKVVQERRLYSPPFKMSSKS